MDKSSSPPASDELEVSVFGPGYGEAIVIHVGDNQWFLIDSCKAPNSEQPASLEYLQSLRVDYPQAVKQIVVSHWDQDHIAGIDSIVGACREAQVVMSSALLTAEFLGLAELHSKSPTASGVEALGRVIALLENRRSSSVRFNSPEWASANTILCDKNIDLEGQSVPIRLIALSPANATLMQSQLALIEHISKATEERKRVAFDKANKASVAVWLEVGPHQILLGGDLEDSPHANDGWKAIVDGSAKFMKHPADLFKIPHHGSENGHNDQVWSDILIPEPYAVVTPWYLAGQYLPTSRDIRRILSFTEKLYQTAPPGLKKSRFIDRTVNRTFREATESSDSLADPWGHVRLRRPILDQSSPWSVDLFGRASLLINEN